MGEYTIYVQREWECLRRLVHSDHLIHFKLV